MSRAQLLLIASLFLLIIVLLGLTFIINQRNSPTNKTPLAEYYLEGEKKVGNGYFNSDGSTLVLYAQIDRIINENNMVEAQISTPLQGKTVKFDVLLYNKNYSGIFSIKLSSDERLGSTKATILTEATDVYRKSKLLEHRLVQMLFRLKPPPDNQTVINCNNQLLEYIKGLRNDLGCVPFGNQISAYAK